jgi:tRNA threonylcarbamoyl adenosine modification protein YjeE
MRAVDPTPTTLFLADDQATEALATRIAAALQPGDLVAIQGGLGAGKTALARGIIRALCEDPQLEVPSPSFALVQPYAAGGWSILHADLYRLQAASEIEELGLLDGAEDLVLVEWPERAPELLAQATMRIAIGIPADGAGRTVTIDAADGRQVQ